MKRTNKKRLAKKEEGWLAHPPPISNLPLTHSIRMRYKVTAAANLGITYQNLLDTWLFTTSATVAYQIFAQVKIRRVSAWAVPVIGGSATVQVGFRGLTVGAAGNSVEKSDTSMGIEPAYVSLAPSRRSQASQYQPSNGNEAFYLLLPAGSVIDVEATFQQYFGYTQAAQNAIAGSVGFVAVRGLDGLAAASTNFPAQADVTV